MTPPTIEYLFVTNIPSPYQRDFFHALQQRRPDSFHVIFCAATESDRTFEPLRDASFSMEILSSPSRRWMKDWHRNPALTERLASYSPRLVILGGSYFMPDARTARSHCGAREIPWIYWGEDPFKKTNELKACLKQLYLRRFLAGAAGAIGVGSIATQSYATLMPQKPTSNIPYSPDLSGLLNPSEGLRSQAESLRRRIVRSSDGPIVLFSGALIERKAPDLLLKAFESSAATLPNAHLVFAGDGPMRATLDQHVRQSNCKDRVHFLGFLNGDNLQAAYLAADLFVLPSRWHEGWGVVVQEAMAAGLPVIASDLVGAGHDLIENRSTGFLFPRGSATELTNQLKHLLSNVNERRSMSVRAREVVCDTTSEAAAAKFIGFAESLLHPMALPASTDSATCARHFVQGTHQNVMHSPLPVTSQNAASIKTVASA